MRANLSYWTRRTKTGRIVYKRKRHDFRGRDLLRMVFGAEPLEGVDAGAAAAALVVLQYLIGKSMGNPDGLFILNSPGRLLDLAWEWASSKTGTSFYQRDPVRATLLGGILTAWRALLAIEEIKDIKEEVL